jgi:ABC-type uncharacterized transport system permease subunit
MKKKLAVTLALAFALVFAVQTLATDKVMEGTVKTISCDAKTITVGKLCFDLGSVDVSEIAVGDTVTVTYTVEGKKNILKSISKAEEEIFLEGC